MLCGVFRKQLGLDFQPRSSWTDIPHSDSMKMPRAPKYVFFGYTRKKYGVKLSPGASPDQYTILQEIQYILRGDVHHGSDIRYK